MKINKKGLSFLTAPLLISYLYGCGVSDKKCLDAYIEEPEFVSTSEDDKINVLSEDMIYSKEQVLEVLNNYFIESKLTLDSALAYGESDMFLYCGALYNKLKNAGLSNEQILRDLENIVLLGVNNTEISEVYWNYFFMNILPTVDNYTNVMDYYYPLAKCVHIYSCPLDHKEECERISCSILKDKVDNLDSNTLTANILEFEVYKSKNFHMKRAFKRIEESSISTSLFMEELELFYELTIVPTDYTQEEFDSWFPYLQSTLNYRENIYDVYYDLALLTHVINCDSIHECNEFGAIGCAKLTYQIEDDEIEY